MAFSRLAHQFPRLAEVLAGQPDPSASVYQLVEAALEDVGVTEKTTTAEVADLVRTLDETAWDLQGLRDRGEASTESYMQAFRKARAANALLDSLNGDDDAAAYEAAHALEGVEDVLVAMVEENARSCDL